MSDEYLRQIDKSIGYLKNDCYTDELFDYAEVPDYYKERVRDYDEYDYDKDDFDLIR